MPTGFTYGVYSGEVTELKDFAAECARGFGVFAHQRDDASTELRYPQKPTDSRWRRAEELRKEWLSSTEEEKYAEWSKYVYDREAMDEAEFRQSTVTKDRYLKMLEQVESVTPPAELENFHDFLRSQLKESLAHDCNLGVVAAIWDYSSWCDYKEEDTAYDVGCQETQYFEDLEKYNKNVAFIDLMAKTYGLSVSSA